jgi:hypothetical protein
MAEIDRPKVKIFQWLRFTIGSRNISIICTKARVLLRLLIMRRVPKELQRQKI